MAVSLERIARGSATGERAWQLRTDYPARGIIPIRRSWRVSLLYNQQIELRLGAAVDVERSELRGTLQGTHNVSPDISSRRFDNERFCTAGPASR